MSRNPLTPAHEDLRRAVQWIGEQSRIDAAVLEEASRRFDLSPLDEDFLFRLFLAHRDGDEA